MILVEIESAIDAVGTTVTRYVSSGPYQTEPTDSPPSENFRNATTDPASLGVSVYRNGRTGGYGQLEVGTLKLANADGFYDGWVNDGFDGRSIIVRLHKAGVPHADMPILFTGTVDTVPEVTRNALVLQLRDKQQILEVPARPNLYGGTNVPPNGIDGGADLKGKRKVVVYGHVSNMEPDPVNSSLEVYRVNDGPVAQISAVYDRGAPFPFHADYPDSAALLAATITAGRYATCLAEGLIRINSSIAGAVTADVVQGAAAANRTAAQIIKQIALAAGLPLGEISAADVAALDAIQPAEVGIYIDPEMTSREAINLVAESVGAYAVFDTPGTLRMGILTEPAGTPIITITDSQALAVERQVQRDGDLPIAEVRLQHSKNWTVQASDLAGSVSADRRLYLKNEWRTAVRSDSSVKLKYLLAPSLEAESLIYDPTNLSGGPADLEALRLLNLYKVKRDMFEVTIHTDVLKDGAIPSLMSLVKLESPRYGLEAGKLFWVLGFRLELRRSQCTLVLWG